MLPAEKYQRKFMPVGLRTAVMVQACLTLLLAGCSPHLAPPLAAEHLQAPADFPDEYYRQAKAAGAAVLRVDTRQSLVTINVSRDGALARLGHDHVVASHDVSGYVDTGAGRADLYVPLEKLSVDEPVLRAQVALTTRPSAEAIEGTQRNMHNKVLESASFPFALVHISRATADRSTLSVTISLHGKTNTYEVPALVETAAGGLLISGQMSFRQSDFGITPFSILGGALQVQDRLELHFRILAAAQS